MFIVTHSVLPIFSLNLLKRGKPHTIEIVHKTIDELDGKQSRGKWNGLLFIVQTQLERVCYHSVVVFFIPLWHFCWFTLCFCSTSIVSLHNNRCKMKMKKITRTEISNSIPCYPLPVQPSLTVLCIRKPVKLWTEAWKWKPYGWVFHLDFVYEWVHSLFIINV